MKGADSGRPDCGRNRGIGRIGMANADFLGGAPLDKLSLDKLSLDKLSIGKLSIDKRSIDKLSLERRFHEGLCLAAGGDFERASAAFVECVIRDPGDGEYVQELLANLRRRPAATAVDKNAGPAMEPMRQAAAKGDWAQVLERGLHVLSEDPRNLQTLLALADAAAAQGYGESEACYIKAAVEAAGNDVTILRWGGAALSRLGKYDDAVGCWRRVEAADPSDEEATEAIAALAIAKCRQRAGLEKDDSHAVRQGPKRQTSGPARWPIYRLTGLAATTDGTARSLTPIQQLEATIRERPSIPEPYLRLSELYLEKDRDYDAERLLAKGREATDNDAHVTQMWEEVAMVRHGRRVQAAEQELKAVDNAQTREALAQATKERDRAEIEIFRARIKRQPDCAEHHYELGRRLMRAGKLAEAGEQFKQALDDADFQAAAALALGDCHAELGELVQALARYRRAAQTASAPSREKRQSRERASKLAAQIKLNKLAERYQRMI
jgi:tetratricopeptide (TPR) repeat protein